MENKLFLKAEMTGLQNIVEETIKSTMDKAITDTINAVASDYIKNNYKDLIESEVSKLIVSQLDNMLYDYKIQVGGDYFSKEPAREVTIAELTNEKVKEYVLSKSFTVPEKSYYGEGTYRKVKTFDEYVKEKLDVENLVKKKLDSEINEIRRDINYKMKDMFDKATRQLLSDTVINILSQNETYKKIEENVSNIANRG